MSQKIVTDFFQRAKMRSLTQEQTEGVIEALVLAMAVDGDIHKEEVSLINAAARLLDWRGDVDIAEYVNTTVSGIGGRSHVLDNVTKITTNIARKLGDEWLNNETYYLVFRLVLADGVIQDSEQAVLASFAKTLSLSPEQQEACENRARSESDA